MSCVIKAKLVMTIYLHDMSERGSVLGDVVVASTDAENLMNIL